MRPAHHIAPLLVSLVVFALSCGGTQTRPATPCMSDVECEGSRICHEGRCRFLSDVEDELAEARERQDAALAGTDLDANVGTDDANVAPHDAREQPTYMGGPRRNGRTEYRGPAEMPTERWVFRTRSRIFASPIVGAGGTIYVGSLDRTFSAIRPDGQLRWRYTGGDKFYATAAVGPDGTVYVGGDDKGVVALTPAGQVRWRQTVNEAVGASILLGPDGRVYVAADGLYAIDGAGEVVWHTATAGHIRTTPALHPNGQIIVGSADGKALAHRRDDSLADADRRERRWRRLDRRRRDHLCGPRRR
jgi:outer membrane protein assembly factor BamB